MFFSRVTSISVKDKSRCFFVFPRGNSRQKWFLPFTKTDVTRLKNIVESSETSHFVENWLLYHCRLLKQKNFRDHWFKNQDFLENLFQSILDKSAR
jgi:hypothetical protein